MKSKTKPGVSYLLVQLKIGYFYKYPMTQVVRQELVVNKTEISSL